MLYKSGSWMNFSAILFMYSTFDFDNPTDFKINLSVLITSHGVGYELSLNILTNLSVIFFAAFVLNCW